MSAEWVDATARARLQPGGMLELELRGTALLLIDVAGIPHATAAICPHHAAWLSQGRLDGTAIDCPRHQGRFDIITGAKLRGPACPDLRVYPAREREGRIEVQLP